MQKLQDSDLSSQQTFLTQSARDILSDSLTTRSRLIDSRGKKKFQKPIKESSKTSPLELDFFSLRACREFFFGKALSWATKK